MFNRWLDKNAPLIAVTGPVKRLPFAWWSTSLANALCGLRSQHITTKRPLLDHRVRGVIIGGGDDVDPEHYGMSGDAGSTYDPDRDHLEMQIVRNALEAGVPILGICRGSQLINIVLGGDLHQDLRPMRSVTPNRNSLLPIKWVDFEKNCQLARVYGRRTLKVNSLHNQAVNTVASDLTAVAKDRDGFIQAFEHRHHPFIVGVQWHPEYLCLSARHRRIFHAFADAVRESDKTLVLNDACLIPDKALDDSLDSTPRP